MQVRILLVSAIFLLSALLSPIVAQSTGSNATNATTSSNTGIVNATSLSLFEELTRLRAEQNATSPVRVTSFFEAFLALPHVDRWIQLLNGTANTPFAAGAANTSSQLLVLMVPTDAAFRQLQLSDPNGNIISSQIKYLPQTSSINNPLIIIPLNNTNREGASAGDSATYSPFGQNSTSAQLPSNLAMPLSSFMSFLIGNLSAASDAKSVLAFVPPSSGQGNQSSGMNNTQGQGQTFDASNPASLLNLPAPLLLQLPTLLSRSGYPVNWLTSDSVSVIAGSQTAYNWTNFYPMVMNRTGLNATYNYPNGSIQEPNASYMSYNNLFHPAPAISIYACRNGLLMMMDEVPIPPFTNVSSLTNTGQGATNTSGNATAGAGQSSSAVVLSHVPPPPPVNQFFQLLQQTIWYKFLIAPNSTANATSASSNATSGNNNTYGLPLGNMSLNAEAFTPSDRYNYTFTLFALDDASMSRLNLSTQGSNATSSSSNATNLNDALRNPQSWSNLDTIFANQIVFQSLLTSPQLANLNNQTSNMTNTSSTGAAPTAMTASNNTINVSLTGNSGNATSSQQDNNLFNLLLLNQTARIVTPDLLFANGILHVVNAFFNSSLSGNATQGAGAGGAGPLAPFR